MSEHGKLKYFAGSIKFIIFVIESKNRLGGIVG